MAPEDYGRYVLQYKLYEAQDVSLEERIEVLLELEQHTPIPKWQYKLAYLYHRIGDSTKCIEKCDEIILWYGEGEYVTKAMELKMQHSPLTPVQQAKYDTRDITGSLYPADEPTYVAVDPDAVTAPMEGEAPAEDDIAEMILDSKVQLAYQDGNYEHMVRPGMVYISHPTELGTIYSRQELTEISRICREYQIPFYLDGARLACALTAKGNDVTLEDLARLTDVFYIGGTKCGAFYGEAVVFTKQNMPFRFQTRVKQHGAMLAKGRILGLQFDVLLSDGEEQNPAMTLYEQGGLHANQMAERIRETLREKGYRFYVETPTNQIFLIVTRDQMKRWEPQVLFSFFEKYDDTHTIIRFATSWATSEQEVDALIRIL